MDWPFLRTDAGEILDREGLGPRGARILADLDRWNEVAGWYRFHVKQIRAHAGRAERVRLLDVGCGPGGLLDAVLRRMPVPVDATAVDRHPDYVALARERLGARVTVVQADATALPFPDASFDVGTCTLMLHHLPREVRAGLVSELGRVCRSVYLFDVERTLSGALGWPVVGALLRMAPDSVHDGVVSVRRGMTLGEFRALCTPLGCDVRRVFPTTLCTLPRGAT